MAETFRLLLRIVTEEICAEELERIMSDLEKLNKLVSDGAAAIPAAKQSVVDAGTRAVAAAAPADLTGVLANAQAIVDGIADIKAAADNILPAPVTPPAPPVPPQDQPA